MKVYAFWFGLLPIIVLSSCSGFPFRTTRDPVSAGSAKLLLEAGETTQTTVLENFGGPNIVAGDSSGEETWTYDRMSYTSERSTLGGVAGGGGGAGPAGGGGILWFNTTRSSTSSRTVTLFLYWKDGLLKSYKYRSSNF